MATGSGRSLSTEVNDVVERGHRRQHLAHVTVGHDEPGIGVDRVQGVDREHVGRGS